MNSALRSRTTEFEQLRKRIISCELCPRLRTYCQQVAQAKKRAYKDFEYWGKPVPGFGDPDSCLLVLGLAPAAHGGNRTGRMFTGDGSGEWLVRALHMFGFANKESSLTRDDGLILKDTYLTATVRCAPPANKPSRLEIENCSSFLAEELNLLEHVKVVLALGKVAFDAYLRYAPPDGFMQRPTFRHGAAYRLGKESPLLVVSYHPSRQNTQTRRLSWEAWKGIFQTIHGVIA